MQHKVRMLQYKNYKKRIIFRCCINMFILIWCTHLQQLKWGIYQLINYCHLHLIKFSVIIDILRHLYPQPQTLVHESLFEKEHSTTTSSLQSTNFITAVSVACRILQIHPINSQLAIVDAPNWTSEGGQGKLGSSQKRAHWELQENPIGELLHQLASELLMSSYGSSLAAHRGQIFRNS